MTRHDTDPDITNLDITNPDITSPDITIPAAEELLPSAEQAAEHVQRMGVPERGPKTTVKFDPIADLHQENQALKDKLLRTAADYENFQKRARRDLGEARRRAREDTLREILPIIDNLERAVSSAHDASELATVVEGVQMVLRGFEDTATRLGLQRVATVGERFDPSVHDAIQQQETSEHPVGTILTEITPGYQFEDRLLRAAMVVVAKAPAPSAPPSE